MLAWFEIVEHKVDKLFYLRIGCTLLQEFMLFYFKVEYSRNLLIKICASF